MPLPCPHQVRVASLARRRATGMQAHERLPSQPAGPDRTTAAYEIDSRATGSIGAPRASSAQALRRSSVFSGTFGMPLP
jgi:hypothetical protein